MALSARLSRADFSGPFEQWRRFNEARLERAMLATTRKGAHRLEAMLREDMTGAGLAGLGRALKATSDDERGGVKVRYANGGFSVSGIVYVRSASERTRGALAAYTAGAEIRPRRGRWLWFPTDDVQRFVGKGKDRQRLTPANWAPSGMEARLGPLVPIRSVNGYPLLAVERVGTSLAGKRRSARSLTKAGRPRKGQRIRELLIVFVAIPFTSRRARVNPRARQREVMASLPTIFRQKLGRI